MSRLEQTESCTKGNISQSQIFGKGSCRFEIYMETLVKTLNINPSLLTEFINNSENLWMLIVKTVCK